MGSQTFGSTIVTQSKLGMFHATAVLLVLIWLLSPLGSQSSLQIVHLQQRQDNFTSTVSYFDTMAKPGFAAPDFNADVSLTALFSGVLMGVALHSDPNDPLVETGDPFGNLIVPDLTRLTQVLNNITDPSENIVIANSTGCEFSPLSASLTFLSCICHNEAA